MNKRSLLEKLMKTAYGLGVLFLLSGMLLSAVAMPVKAQEETPPAPTEEAPTEEVVLIEEVTPTEEVVLTEEVTPTEEAPMEAAASETTEEAAEQPELPELAASFVAIQNGTYEVQFADMSTGEITAWTWNFGDDSEASNEQNPLHQYAEAGEYDVTLMVTAADGTTATVTTPVVLEESIEPEPLTEEQIAETAVEVIELLNEGDKTLVNDNGEVISVASQEFSESVASGDPFFWDGTQWVGYAVGGVGCPSGVTLCIDSATPFQAAVNAAPEGSTIYVAQGNYNETVTITTNNLNFVGFSLIEVLSNGTINPDTFYSGYATVNKIILNALFGTTSGVYAEEVVVDSGGRLTDGLELVDSDGEVTAKVQLVSDGHGYYMIRDANDASSTFIWECGEPDVFINPGTTYTMVFKAPYDSEILNYYSLPENGDKRGLGLDAAQRIDDFIIGINKIAELQAAGGYTATGEQEKQFFWYLLGNNNYNNLTPYFKNLANEILNGNYDNIDNTRTIWFLWPSLQGSNTVSPSTVQLTTINFGTPRIYGCTDPESDNYNPNANYDDGSCMTYCEWDNTLPTGHPDCYPKLSLETVACEVNEDGGGTHYTWSVNIVNDADEVPFSWQSTSGESGNGIAYKNGGATFMTDKPTTTAVTITWWDENTSLTEEVPAEMECPPDMQALLLLDPFCSLVNPEVDEHDWQMVWTIENPNPWDVQYMYSVDNGIEMGPFLIPGGGTVGLVNTPLGSYTVKVTWDGGNESITVSDGLWVNICENWPYNPPDVPEYNPIIPVTGGELEAPASGGELLIPVTGADMSAPLVSTGFFTNLYTSLGLFFLGFGLVLQGVRTRLPK